MADPTCVDETNFSPHELTFPASSWLMLCSKLLKTGHLGKGDRAAAKLALGVGGLSGWKLLTPVSQDLQSWRTVLGFRGWRSDRLAKTGKNANNNGSSMDKCLRGI